MLPGGRLGLGMMHDVEQLPEWSRTWAGKRLAQHAARGLPMSAEQWRGLRDWLAALPAERPKMPGKLHKLTLEQALVAVQRWHEAMAARSRRMARRRRAFGGDPDAVEMLAEAAGLPGWRWVRVLTPEGLDYEGEAMGHCVGRGSYDDEDSVILSLRDPDNLPHCTVEYHEDSRSVKQVQGWGNRLPLKSHEKAIASFLNTLQPVGLYGRDYYGNITTDSTLPPWRDDLFDGLSVVENLNLSGCTGLTHLPAGLIVNGDLDLSDCGYLTHLPDGLTVGGSLYLGSCVSLTHLPDGLSVGGSLSLNSCVRLTKLPDGLTVGKSVYLSDCDGLTHLPDGLSVGGSLHLDWCEGLTHLPDRLSVGGTLDLTWCTSLTHLPEGLSVCGDLILEDCKSLVHLPLGLTVRGQIRGAESTFLPMSQPVRVRKLSSRGHGSLT